jgi:hypothetical protein
MVNQRHQFLLTSPPLLLGCCQPFYYLHLQVEYLLYIHLFMSRRTGYIRPNLGYIYLHGFWEKHPKVR